MGVVEKGKGVYLFRSFDSRKSSRDPTLDGSDSNLNWFCGIKHGQWCDDSTIPTIPISTYNSERKISRR